MSLSKIDPGTEVFILGDFNIDLQRSTSPLFSRYKDILDSYNFDQLISEPTRITSNSSSLIDHILTNVGDFVQEKGVIASGFSDHCMTFCTRRSVKGISFEPSIKRIRSFKSYSKEVFLDQLRKVDWFSVLSSDDVNFAVMEFGRLFKLVIDKVAPYREVRVRSKRSPWMNSHILSLIRKRDSAFSRFKADRSNSQLYREFCQLRNAVQRDVKLAKESFFKQKVQQNKGDSGKLWSHLRSLGYSKKSTNSSSNIVLDDNGQKVFDSFGVAQIFNNFYTSVASKLVSKLPSSFNIFGTATNIFKDFYSRRIGLRSHFVISPVSSHFVQKQLRALDPKKAVGLDDISSLFLRDGADVITYPVAHIINLSIITETVPSVFKEAKVVPLFKKGSKLDPGNYRPVSLLNVLSKILERAVHSQLSHYLETRGLLFKNQSGFRGGFSTDSCLIGLTDYVKGELGRGNFVGMVLIDLQKAFDTVDHGILSQKLRAIGVSSFRWFESYLCDRRQCVEVNGTRSEFLPVGCGVPQGSILGPLLFLVYINDMNISLNCRLSLYADDSALLFSHNDVNVIADRLSCELSSCKRWLVDNKLSLHVGKTECLLFGTKGKLKRVGSFLVYCDGTLVDRVSHVKYLGVQLDASLDGSKHVGALLKTCAGRLAFLYRNVSLLDHNCRRILCSALIQPYVDYCCSSWYGGLSRDLKGRLDVLQRKMVRFVQGMDSMYHVGQKELRDLSWLSVYHRVMFFQMLHLFRIRHDLAPAYLRPNFTLLYKCHSYGTRGSSNNFHLSREISSSPTSFTFLAIKQWNSLPTHIKTISSLPTFKNKLKDFLFSSYS